MSARWVIWLGSIDKKGGRAQIVLWQDDARRSAQKSGANSTNDGLKTRPGDNYWTGVPDEPEELHAMKKTAARKSKTNESSKRTLNVKRETLKDLTPNGQQVKAGGPHCTGCTRSR